ncbi:MAG TPA: hypothetical protein VF267_00855 [Gammaproteobacteria bacterium]
MNKKDTTYRMPEGFNPFSAVDAARGLADAIHWMHSEGPAAADTVEFGDKLALDSLVDLLRKQVHELHDYIHEIANSTSLHLPMSDAEFDTLRDNGFDGVRETAPVYVIR